MEGSLVAYKVFTNGSVLNASEINENLMNQSVMVFSNSTARAAALTAPVEGMLTWLQDTNKYENYNGSAWVALGGSGILQVVSTTKTDVFSTSSSSYVDVTGLSVTITPSSATNKLLINWGINFSQTSSAGASHFVLTNGSNTVLVQGDTSGVRTRTTEGSRVVPVSVGDSMETMINAANSYLYSPATTSAVTIKFRGKIAAAGTLVVNRNGVFNNDDANGVPVSSLTVMEVFA
jgi:hypothetical protein